jgi:hypothetical protein
MQPYSELANWDGSLEDLVVDPLGPPSPSDTPSLPMYDQYHHNQSIDQQVCRSSSLTLLFPPSLNPALIQTTRCKKNNLSGRSRAYIIRNHLIIIVNINIIIAFRTIRR